jgi:hypothetical protein
MTSERSGEDPADDGFSGPAEAWEPWETQLVVVSLALGAGGLVLLGWLVDYFILP